MNRKVYREIAKKHGVSAKEVKSDMQEFVNYAYTNPNSALGNPRNNEPPTIDGFIKHSVKLLEEKDIFDN